MNMIREILPERYKFISDISSGAFGEVIAVHDKSTGYKRALKILKAFSKRKAQTFRTEFTKLSALNHPNLINVYDYGLLQSGKPYFTMELVHGKDLISFLKKKGNIKYLPDIIAQSLAALKYLHNRGMLHGDIKPENIMVTSDKKVKLLDFGLVVRKGINKRRLSGTPGYLAPEAIKSGIYTEASDLYALGGSLLESTIGTRGQQRRDIIYKELQNKLSSAGLKTASSLSSFILDLCSPDIETRPENADQAILSFEMSSRIRQKARTIDLDNIFVGRKKELRYAEKFLKRKLDKRLLIIEGIVGSGGKTLAREIKKRAQVDGFITIELDGLEHISSPIRVIFDLVAQNLEAGESKKLRKRIERLYKAFRQKTVETIGEKLSDIYIIDLYLNLSKLFIEYSRLNPILIILKNIESFEKDFLRLVSQLEQVLLTDSVDSILLVGTLNTDRKSKTQDSLNVIREHELTDSINLPPLTKHEVREFIEQAFNNDLFIDKEIELMLEKTNGIPLLVIELLKQLISKGLIFNDENGWNRKGEIYLNIPLLSSIDEIFAEKWQVLNRDEKRAIRIAAFFDSNITIRMLSHLARVNAYMLNRSIHLGLLKTDGNQVEFVNPLFREAVKRHTRSETRRKVNLSIASFLESSKRKDIIRIARYYLESWSPDLAYKYGLEAAKNLISNNELHLAYDYLLKLKRILAHSNRKEEFVNVLLPLAKLEELFGQVGEAINDYNAIIANSNNTGIKSIATLHLGVLIHNEKGDINKGYMLFRKASKLAYKTNDKKLIALTLARLSETMKGKEKEKTLLKAMNIAKDVDIDVYSLALRKLIYYYRYTGNIQKSEKYFLNAVSIAENLSYSNKLDLYKSIWIYKYYTSDYQFIVEYFGNLYTRKRSVLSYVEKTKLAMMYAGLDYVLARYNEMISLLNDSLTILNMQKAYYYIVRVYYNLLLAYRSMANYERCLDIINEIQHMKKKGNIKYYSLYNIFGETSVYSLLGNYFNNIFEASMLKCRRAISKQNEYYFQGHYYLTNADNKYFNLRLKHALNNIDKAIPLLRKVNSRDDLAESLLKKAIILCELGESKKARRHIKKAWGIYEAIHCEYLRPQLLLAKGMVERLNGKDEALNTLKEGFKTCRRMLTREQTWQIQRQLALLWKDRGYLKRALKYYKDAIETIKQITESIPTEKIKLSYLDVPYRKRVFDEIKELKKELVN